MTTINPSIFREYDIRGVVGSVITRGGRGDCSRLRHLLAAKGDARDATDAVRRKRRKDAMDAIPALNR